MQPLRRREDLRIHRGRADRLSDHAHRLPHRVEKGGAGVLHQVPAIRHLKRLRRAFGHRVAIATATVARQGAYAWMVLQPRRDCRRLPVRQQRHDATALEIADDRAVPMVLPERPIVDADDRQRVGGRTAPPPHDPQ